MTNSKKIEWALRIGIFGEFVAHGAFALSGKADWIKWIDQLLRVGPETAATILTLVGIFDLIVALIILAKPVNAILLWAVFWGFWTALLRPIVGQSWLDFIERWTNWAAPLALFFLLKKDK